jgi:hypothetical protein
MRRNLESRIEKFAFKRTRPASQLTDAELDEVIRSSIAAQGGTDKAAAARRAQGDEHGACFIELFMVGDDRWEHHVAGMKW